MKIREFLPKQIVDEPYVLVDGTASESPMKDGKGK